MRTPSRRAMGTLCQMAEQCIRVTDIYSSTAQFSRHSGRPPDCTCFLRVSPFYSPRDSSWFSINWIIFLWSCLLGYQWRVWSIHCSRVTFNVRGSWSVQSAFSCYKGLLQSLLTSPYFPLSSGRQSRHFGNKYLQFLKSLLVGDGDGVRRLVTNVRK